MMWAAEEYAWRCGLRMDREELETLRRRRDEAANHRDFVAVQDDIYEVHRAMQDKYMWLHRLQDF